MHTGLPRAYADGAAVDVGVRFRVRVAFSGCRVRSSWLLSAAQLQQRLENGKVLGLAENSSRDAQRSKCVAIVKLQTPEKETHELIWLLADDFDPRERSGEDWRIVRITGDKKQAQSFFKHSLPTSW